METRQLTGRRIRLCFGSAAFSPPRSIEHAIFFSPVRDGLTRGVDVHARCSLRLTGSVFGSLKGTRICFHRWEWHGGFSQSKQGVRAVFEVGKSEIPGEAA